MEKKECLKSLKQTLTEFIQDIGNFIATNTEVHFVNIFLDRFSSYSELSVMAGCIKNLLPHAKEIKKRDDAFIKSGLVQLFEEIIDVQFPFDLKIETRLDDQDKATVWNYLDLMVSITQEYKKQP